MTEDKQIEWRCLEMLKELGVSWKLSGVLMVCKAVVLINKDITYTHNITKTLYPDIAKLFDTTPTRVERNIRHVISRLFKTGNCEMLNELFGYVIHLETGTVSNGEFLTMLTYYIQHDLNL